MAPGPTYEDLLHYWHQKGELIFVFLQHFFFYDEDNVYLPSYYLTVSVYLYIYPLYMSILFILLTLTSHSKSHIILLFFFHTKKLNRAFLFHQITTHTFFTAIISWTISILTMNLDFAHHISKWFIDYPKFSITHLKHKRHMSWFESKSSQTEVELWFLLRKRMKMKYHYNTPLKKTKNIWNAIYLR